MNTFRIGKYLESVFLIYNNVIYNNYNFILIYIVFSDMIRMTRENVIFERHKTMDGLDKHVRFVSGSPQFRVLESIDEQAPVYRIYSQNDLLNDLSGIELDHGESKIIRTNDEVFTLFTGDIIFSLISGNACIVSKKHEGYMYTQNYIKLFTDSSINPTFLVYLLNEDQRIKKQFQIGLQGSSILKYTLKQLRDLKLPVLPSLEKQKMIGDIYFKQLKVEALKKRVAEKERILTFRRLERGRYE